jgi:hypothetical protein
MLQKKYKVFPANVFRLLGHLEVYTKEHEALMVEKLEIVKRA